MRNMLALMTLLLLLAGCSDSVPEQELTQLGEAYKTAQYQISSDPYPDEMTFPEKLKPYLTQERYAKLVQNREAAYPILLAKEAGSSLSMQSITFEHKATHEDTVEYEYTMVLSINGEKTVTKLGQMGFTQVDGEWSIYRDSDEKLKPSDFEK